MLDYSPLTKRKSQSAIVLDANYIAGAVALATCGLMLWRYDFSAQYSIGVLTLAVFVFVFGLRTRYRHEEDPVVAFALTNGFLPRAVWHRPPSPGGLLFGRGINARQINYISGRWRRVTYQLYDYWFQKDVDSKKRQHIQVLELDLGVDLPHIFIENHRNDRRYNKQFKRNLVRDASIHLGGDLDEHYTIYVAADYELEGILLADNNLLTEILHTAPHFDIELLNGRAYAYAPASSFKNLSERYKETYALLDTLTRVLPHKLRNWRFTRLRGTSVYIREKTLLSDSTESILITALSWTPILVFSACLLAGLAAWLWILSSL